ncbi:MAG: LOG family protein [Candidatus Dormibacteria bacterium]
MDTQDPGLVYEMLVSVVRVAGDSVSRLDRKIVATALREMSYAFSVFAQYRERRKLTIFGSARTRPDQPEYHAAHELGQRCAAEGWMVVTGAGPGIMQAGNEGAGAASSFGVNILLPFEQKPNDLIAGDPKLMNFKYFFTRKLMFIKESDAFVLLPGGFGTMDELFELLTLVQTGKSDLHPIVLLDAPGGDYWQGVDAMMRQHLAGRYIDPADLRLYHVTDSVDDAIGVVDRFYRVYHSQRYVGRDLVLRLNRPPTPGLAAQLSLDFADIMSGPVVECGPSQAELGDDDVPLLPRLRFPFDRAHFARLRQLVDRVNQD